MVVDIGADGSWIMELGSGRLQAEPVPEVHDKHSMDGLIDLSQKNVATRVMDQQEIQHDCR